MSIGFVKAICISPAAGAPMQKVEQVQALAGRGLEGDRYCTGEGSWNKDQSGHRQVTLINHLFIERSSFLPEESRRNISVLGTELMWLIGREFQIGFARMRGIAYCDPCRRPSKLAGKTGFNEQFSEQFFDRGGLVAEVLKDGIIRIDDRLIPPDKGY